MTGEKELIEPPDAAWSFPVINLAAYTENYKK
jgi:hypothetical protein